MATGTSADRDPTEQAELPGGVSNISRRRLSLAITFEWACRALGIGLGIAVMALLTRYLGPSRFGDLGFALALTGIAHYTADVGFKQAAIRHASLEPERRDALAGTFVVLRGMVACGLYAVVCTAGILLAHDRESAVVVIVVAGILPLAFFSSAGFLLHVRLRNELFAANLLLQSVLWLAVVIAAVVWEWSLPGIAVGYLATFVVQTVVVFRLSRRLVPFRFMLDRGLARTLLRAAIPLTAAGLFMALLLRLDSVLVYEISGARQAGFYSSAYRVLEQLQIVPAAIVALVSPLLARWLATDSARYRRLVSTFLRYLTLVAIPTSFSICVLADPLVVLLFGADFGRAGDYLAVLVLAFLGTAVSALFFGALVAAGEVRLLAVTQGTLLIGVLAADLTLLPSLGPMAAAVVTVVGELALAAALYWHLLHRDLIAAPTLGALRILAPVAALATVGLPLLAIDELAAAAGGALAFFLMAFAAGVLTMQELRLLLSRDVVATI